MERMLVVVFDSEDKAHDAISILNTLDDEGVIAVYAALVVIKDLLGAIMVIKTHDPLPEDTLGGSTLGGFIGALGGPVGIAAGIGTGFIVGAVADYARSRVGSDFVSDVAAALLPGKCAVVAEIDEEATDTVDTRMELLGGVVFRRALSEVRDADYVREMAAIKADIAQTQAEIAASRAERKARLQSRIDTLNEKLRQAREQARARHEATKRETAARVEHLKAQAAHVRQDIKARHEQRIAVMERSYQLWLDEWETYAM
jgi:uncharacterized membrane protein